LGLDGDEILRRFRAEGTGFVPKAELSFLAPVPDRAVPTGAIVLLGVVLVLVGYGLWYRHTEEIARLAAEIPSVPTELAPLAVPPKPPAPVVQAAAKPAAAPPTPVAAAVPANGKPANPPVQATASAVSATQATAPQAAARATVPAAPVPSPAASPGKAAIAALPPAPAPPQPAANQIQPITMTILATGDSWVQVKDPNGNVLFSKTLHAGDSWPVPDLPGLVMTAGNAGNTLIAENGKTGSPLGNIGTVLRNYALTAPAPAGAAPAGAAPAGTAPAGAASPSSTAPTNTN